MSDKPLVGDQRTFTGEDDDQASSYLAAIVESSDDAIIGKSLDGTISFWNAAAERLYGYAAAEAVGRNVSLIVPPDGKDELSDLLRRIRRGERIQHYWAERARKDGTIILVSLSISPVCDASGRIVGAATIARGTGEDRGDGASEAARHARSLIEVSINPLVAISPRGKITDVNKATEEATGIPRDRLIGTDFADCFTEPEKARAAYQIVLEEGLLSDYPLMLRNVSGALTAVEYSATVYRNEAGELQAVFAAARDATETKRARLQVARLAAIVASSQNAMFSKDLEGTITHWNAAAETLYGYAAEEAIGRNVAILLPPGCEGETQELIKRMLRGELVSGLETQRMRKDGSLLDVALTMSPIRNPAGDIVALSVIGHDVTERNRAERELRESEQKFAAAFQASPDLMAVTRITDGTLLEVNEAFSKLLGHSRAESIGRTTAELCIWADPADRATFVASLEKSGKISNSETTLRRKDGTLVACLHSARIFSLQDETCVLSVIHDISKLKETEQQLHDSLGKLATVTEGVIAALAGVVEARDPYTAGHERRVAGLSEAIATRLGLDETTVTGVRVAALLHDVGKITVPTEILNKPGRLSEAEFQLIKMHPQATHDVLRGIEFPWPVAEVALQHHERLDGSGYPRGLAGEEIILEARILAVADVVEAMASHRPYRPGLGIDAALEEIEQHSGSLFDAEVVEACADLFRRQGFALAQPD